MNLTLLTTADPTAWDEALRRRDPAADIYYSASYHAAHVANGDGDGKALLVEDGDSWLFLPFLTAPIPGHPSLADVQSCPGYSGPLGQGDADFMAEAWRVIELTLARAGVVAAFLRLHPLLGNEALLPAGWEVVADRLTASIDLTGGIEAAFAGKAGANHRAMVKRARTGVVAVMDWPSRIKSPLWGDPFGYFAEMYGDGMAAEGAASQYRYSLAYFEALRRLGAQVRVMGAFAGQNVAAYAMILLGPRWAHYHLAMRGKGFVSGAMNLLLDGAAQHAAVGGLEAVHLGGGLTPADDDLLWRFKARVGQRRHTFVTARRILDPDRYWPLWGEARGRLGHEPKWALPWREEV